ncbi:DNA-binding transcriptional LysR family regulator [Prauserella shujinwangii]|uniref:DNA-binding transcriptional LysR family regulator n=1 Tax=Prauserella shujinwangii TaxID=1453103 RepID=A0A2T0LSU9_9PSEU|nr:LysR family transcriptional regulator [Prauserella shujinwangii]PRX46702.1 DNA-binding transcriptional LysR family regulator [Prauserella shujinwangii]
MDLDLAQVRAFTVTAELRSFSRAAERLFLTQQALSKRVRRLEDAVGAPLFVRGPRTIELTGAGERFLPHARELIRAADAAAAALATGDGRPLRLDVLDHRLAPTSLLRTLSAQDPGLTVERDARGGLGAAVDALLRDETDLAFGRVHDLGRELPPDVEHRLVRLEPLLAVLPPEHPLAAGAAVRLADLREEGLWLPSTRGPVEFRLFLERLGREFDVPLDFTGTSYGLRHTLEQARYGRHRVTLSGADMDLPRDLNLRVLPFHPAPLFPWSAVWRRDDRRPALRALVALLERVSGAEGWCAHDPDRTWLPGADRISAGAGAARR